MADSVAKVEKLGAAKIDVRAGVRRKRRSQASPRSWGSRPWREQSVEWTPTDFFERHLHGPEKVAPTEPEDFCNNIGPTLPTRVRDKVGSYPKYSKPADRVACPPRATSCRYGRHRGERNERSALRRLAA